PGQRLALEELHHQEVAVFVTADIVDNTDVRMIQAGERLRLAFESGSRVRRIRDGLEQYLDRNRTFQTRITGFVDFSHATGANALDDFVVTESRSGIERQSTLL